MSEIADEVICLVRPLHFAAVGEFYRNFKQVTDDEVAALLDRAARAMTIPAARSKRGCAMRRNKTRHGARRYKLLHRRTLSAHANGRRRNPSARPAGQDGTHGGQC